MSTVAVVTGILACAGIMIATACTVARDGYGPRITRTLYDTRRPQ